MHKFWIGTIALGLGLGLAPLGPVAASPPQVGTCWPFSDRQWDRSSLAPVAPVDCGTSHTAEAMAVVKMPKKIAKGSDKAMWAWAFQKCHNAAMPYLLAGQSVPLPVKSYALPATAQLATYIPTSKQWRAGERWVACVGFNTSLGTAVPRTGAVRGQGVLPHECVSTSTWRTTPCSASGAAQLTNVVWLSKKLGQKYPGTRKAVKQAKVKCKALARSRGKNASVWFVPGKSAWNYGDRYGYCQI